MVENTVYSLVVIIQIYVTNYDNLEMLSHYCWAIRPHWTIVESRWLMYIELIVWSTLFIYSVCQCVTVCLLCYILENNI